MPDADDIFDYPMSDQFISETRQRPYRVGFRPCRHPRRPSLAYLKTLPDREFYRYIQNGCRLPAEAAHYEDELDGTRAELRQLRNELDSVKAELLRLRQLLIRPSANSSSQRGLDVPAR